MCGRQAWRRSFRDLWSHALRRLSAEVISVVHRRFSCRIRADLLRSMQSFPLMATLAALSVMEPATAGMFRAGLGWVIKPPWKALEGQRLSFNLLPYRHHMGEHRSRLLLGPIHCSVSGPRNKSDLPDLR